MWKQFKNGTLLHVYELFIPFLFFITFRLLLGKFARVGRKGEGEEHSDLIRSTGHCLCMEPPALRISAHGYVVT